MAIAKIVLNSTTQIDLTQDTVADASHIRSGYVGHLNDGTQVTGSYGGATPTLITKSITSNGTYNASSDNADGYSQVTVNVSGSSGMNVQAYHGSASVTGTSSYTATTVKLTVAKTGTYKVSWTGTRSSTSGTSGSQLYIDDTAYGSAQTSFGLSNYGQCINLTGVSLTKDQEIVVYAKPRGTNYTMHVANLVIEQTA